MRGDLCASEIKKNISSLRFYDVRVSFLLFLFIGRFLNFLKIEIFIFSSDRTRRLSPIDSVCLVTNKKIDAN